VFCRWNYAFKAQITALQHVIREKSSVQNAKKAELTADLNLFMESALGFYMQVSAFITSVLS